MSAAWRHTSIQSSEVRFPWLLAAVWLGIVGVPPLLLMFVALGQWRIPVDASVVGALLLLLRGRIGPWLLWTAYYLVVGLFILHSFNLDLGGLSFYAEFAGSIPPPTWELRLAVIVCALLPIVGVHLASRARLARREVIVLAVVATLVTSGLRALPSAPPAVRFALPAPSLTMAVSSLAAWRVDPSLVAAQVHAGSIGPLAVAIASAPLPDQFYLFTMESWTDNADGLVGLAEEARSRFGERVVEIKTGFRPSYGATLQGELRELCAIEQPIHRLSDISFNDCLPNRLKTLGYETAAGHGYQSMFYLRAALYPRMGFQQRYFLDELKRNIPTCPGAFVGLCDRALLAHLLDVTDPGHKRLVYQMTLQSHEPVGTEVLAEYGITAAQTNSTAVAHAFVLSALGRLAAPRGAECGALIYFVGDHPPPSLKASGALKEEVSYLLLRLAPSPRCKLS